MGQLKHSAACLRIIGDNLDPDEISRWLGASPTFSQKKGAIIKRGRREIPAPFGMWRLNATDREPANVDSQIDEILSQLTPDLSVWKSIPAEYAVHLFCGWFVQSWNEEVSISAESMAALGSRGIRLDLDLYVSSGDDEDHESDSE